MVASMTAFGRSSCNESWGQLICEVRSVNHRHFDLKIHLPVEFRGLEEKIREKIAARLMRGKVDCFIHHHANGVSNLSVNYTLAQALVNAAKQIESSYGLSAPINSMDVLAFPKVIEIDQTNDAEKSAAVSNMLDQALDSLVATRKREGDKIQEMLSRRCDTVIQHIASIDDKLPVLINRQREKLHLMISQMDVQIEPEKLAHEVAAFMQKNDITEELDRLRAHVDEFVRVIAAKGAIGQRLNFLLQEMNRETNTLGAKSTHINISNIAINLKVLIEQMREQVQNVE